MEYISTRNKKLNFDFKDVFLRGLAPDGGLFIPKNIKTYSKSELINLEKLSYVDLAIEIISNFCPDIEKDKLSRLIKKSYENLIGKYYSPFEIKNILEDIDEIIDKNNLQFVEHNVEEEVLETHL